MRWPSCVGTAGQSGRISRLVGSIPLLTFSQTEGGGADNQGVVVEVVGGGEQIV